jgi:hypothetical protein
MRCLFSILVFLMCASALVPTTLGDELEVPSSEAEAISALDNGVSADSSFRSGPEGSDAHHKNE